MLALFRVGKQFRSRCAGFKKVVWMLQMMCCARWLFARRCKLEENLHQNVVFLALLLRWKNFPDHKLLVLLRIWRSLATVWHFFSIFFYVDKSIPGFHSVDSRRLMLSDSSTNVLWQNPACTSECLWKLTCQRKMHQVSQLCVSCKMSCPKSAKTPHANTHPKTDARRCWTMHMIWSFTWLLWWLLKYLYNFRNVHCIVQSPRTMKVKNISKGNKFILTTMVMVNAMQCKSTCACQLSNCSPGCTDEVCHLTCFSVSFFLSCLSFSFKKKNKTKKGKNGTGTGERERENPSKWPEQNLLSSFSFRLFFRQSFDSLKTSCKLKSINYCFFCKKKTKNKQGSILKKKKEGN